MGSRPFAVSLEPEARRSGQAAAHGIALGAVGGTATKEAGEAGGLHILPQGRVCSASRRGIGGTQAPTRKPMVFRSALTPGNTAYLRRTAMRSPAACWRRRAAARSPACTAPMMSMYRRGIKLYIVPMAPSTPSAQVARNRGSGPERTVSSSGSRRARSFLPARRDPRTCTEAGNPVQRTDVDDLLGRHLDAGGIGDVVHGPPAPGGLGDGAR